jgi:hypothetical protein
MAVLPAYVAERDLLMLGGDLTLEFIRLVDSTEFAALAAAQGARERPALKDATNPGDGAEASAAWNARWRLSYSPAATWGCFQCRKTWARTGFGSCLAAVMRMSSDREPGAS